MNIQKYLQLKIKLTDLEGADLTQYCELKYARFNFSFTCHQEVETSATASP